MGTFPKQRFRGGAGLQDSSGYELSESIVISMSYDSAVTYT